MRGGLVAETFEKRIVVLEEAAAKREADRPTPGAWEVRRMASKGELENRLSRMEATAAREAGGADDAFSLRVLSQLSLKDEQFPL